MDATELGLLRAIVTTPADDTPRLAYADWLQENGDEPRAHWVRKRVARPDVVTRLGPSDSVTAFGGEVARGVRDWRGKGVYPDGKVFYRRGFAESVECTAEMWLASADALAWHPAQTAACGACDEGRIWHERDSQSSRECGVCDGTGRVPRPFPATAQPIEAVTLTTQPTEGDLRRLFGLLPADDLRDLARRYNRPHDRAKMTLETVWPGIAFALPPEPPPPAPPATDPYGGFLVPPAFAALTVSPLLDSP